MSEIPKQEKEKCAEENTNAAFKLPCENKMTQRQATEAFCVPKTENARLSARRNARTKKIWITLLAMYVKVRFK